MNVTAEIKAKDGAFIRIMSAPDNNAIKTRVIIAAQDFEFEVDAAELVAAIQACSLRPAFGHIVRTGQHSPFYQNADVYLRGAAMNAALGEKE
jgi:hypothetical protein